MFIPCSGSTPSSIPAAESDPALTPVRIWLGLDLLAVPVSFDMMPCFFKQAATPCQNRVDHTNIVEQSEVW